MQRQQVLSPLFLCDVQYLCGRSIEKRVGGNQKKNENSPQEKRYLSRYSSLPLSSTETTQEQTPLTVAIVKKVGFGGVHTSKTYISFLGAKPTC